jgi:hypothetical protein
VGRRRENFRRGVQEQAPRTLTAGGPFAVMESSEASLALIVRTEVADRRNATCHDGRA